MLAIETYLFSSGVAWQIAEPMLQSPMIVLALFIGLSWGASHFAHSLKSTTSQYVAFAVLVVAWSLMFVPMLAMALIMDQSGSMIQSAAGVTVFGCAALIATVMITRKDFSFLRGILVWGFFIAMGLIAASLIFGWNLGTWFSVGMIGFAGVAVSVRHLEHHAPLPSRQVRGRVDGVVRVDRTDVLVHPATVHEPRLTRTTKAIEKGASAGPFFYSGLRTASIRSRPPM